MFGWVTWTLLGICWFKMNLIIINIKLIKKNKGILIQAIAFFFLIFAAIQMKSVLEKLKADVKKKKKNYLIIFKKSESTIHMRQANYS